MQYKVYTGKKSNNYKLSNNSCSEIIVKTVYNPQLYTVNATPVNVTINNINENIDGGSIF